MLEFTISMTDANLEFKPFREEPDLEFMLAPTARIGEDDDNVHLAPIPVHGFFNAVVFSNWLATTNGISVADAFAVYLLHDMFKSLLRLRPKGHKKTWLHGGQREFFETAFGRDAEEFQYIIEQPEQHIFYREKMKPYKPSAESRISNHR